MTTEPTPFSPDLWNQAYANVVRIRGSNDVPAFDLCVEAEYQQLKEIRDAKQ